MNSQALPLAGISFALMVAVYIALNLIWPFEVHEEPLPFPTKVEDVYASNLALTPAPQIAAVPAPPSTPPAPPPATEPSRPAAAPAAEVAAVEPAAKPVSKPAPVAKAPPPAPIPRPAIPTPKAPAAVASAPKPPRGVVASAAPAVAPAAPASKPPATTTAPTKAPVAKPGADILTQWWPRAPAPGRLNLLFAGQASTEKSVALLFDSPLSQVPSAADARLLDANGATVQGRWELNPTRRMLLFRGLKPGRYMVLLTPAVANASRQTLGTPLHGPVYVR